MLICQDVTDLCLFSKSRTGWLKKQNVKTYPEKRSNCSNAFLAYPEMCDALVHTALEGKYGRIHSHLLARQKLYVRSQIIDMGT